VPIRTHGGVNSQLHILRCLGHRRGQGAREGTRGTSYPGPVDNAAWEDESTHAKFFWNQA